MHDCTSMILFRLIPGSKAMESVKKNLNYKHTDDALYCEWLQDGVIIFQSRLKYKGDEIWGELKIRMNEVERIDIIQIPSAIKKYKEFYNLPNP